MTAHVLPFSPAQLAQACADERLPLRVRLSEPLVRISPNWWLDAVANFVSAEFTRAAHAYAKQALVFENLAERVNNVTGGKPLDPKDSLYAMLIRVERRLQREADENHAVWGPAPVRPGSRRAQIRIAALHAAEAAGAAAAAVRDLRGAMQAHDANVDAISRAKRACTSAAELEDQLASLSTE